VVDYLGHHQFRIGNLHLFLQEDYLDKEYQKVVYLGHKAVVSFLGHHQLLVVYLAIYKNNQRHLLAFSVHL
jgi:hypothetical protein